MKTIISVCFALIFLAGCAANSPEVSAGDSSTTEAPQTTASSSKAEENPQHLDSLVRGYSTESYTIIDTFSEGNKTKLFQSKKDIIRTTYAFSADKILYNTGVKTDEFTAVVAGFNTGTYVLENAPMDGIVFRMIEKNNYWHVQCNVANGFIHENATVDVLFIRNTKIDNE